MGSHGRKQYTADFKRDAVGLVTQQGYSVAEAAQNLGVNAGLLRRWKTETERTGTVAFPGKGHQTPDQADTRLVAPTDNDACARPCELKGFSWVGGAPAP